MGVVTKVSHWAGWVPLHRYGAALAGRLLLHMCPSAILQAESSVFMPMHHFQCGAVHVWLAALAHVKKHMYLLASCSAATSSMAE